MFTNSPLTADTLVARLSAYKFWTKKHVKLSVARSIIQAAKVVAQERDRLPDHIFRRSRSIGLLPYHDPHKILDKIYKHPAIVSHFSILWRDILFIRPSPSISTQVQLIRHEPSLEIIAGAIRTTLARNDFLTAFKFIDIVRPQSNVQVLGMPIALAACGLGSAGIWLASPLIALILAIFWTGLAQRFIPQIAVPFVEFDQLKTSFLFRLKNLQKLRLANMIMTSYNETGTINAANYHRRYLNISNSDSFKHSGAFRDIEYELRKRGMKIRRQLSLAEKNYADYWSPNVDQWQRVEWQEPDQDPAELLRK